MPPMLSGILRFLGVVMARITIEDCLKFVPTRYELVHLCAKRTRQIFRGSERLVQCKNNNVVAALREIAAGKVRFRKLITEQGEEAALTQ